MGDVKQPKNGSPEQISGGTIEGHFGEMNFVATHGAVKAIPLQLLIDSYRY